MDTGYLLAIDQGTTSTRAIAFTPGYRILATHQIPLRQYYPENGWVEHDAAEIWQAVLACVSAVTEETTALGWSPLAIGITNQRETTVVWDRRTGEPLHRAIVWQDRRTADRCSQLADASGVAEMVHETTGLLLDPYFSGTKLGWILENEPSIRQQAAEGNALFGTIESYLLYRLTAGECHKSDATNASRTMLCDIRQAGWSDDLLDLLSIPRSMLPEICDNAGRLGIVAPGLPAAGIPITGMIGDQQSAAVGQGCIRPGQAKSTYGTGCFLLENTGSNLVYSQNRLLSTIAYKLDGKLCYAAEGSIFNAGTVVQWLRDDLGILESASHSEELARSVNDTGGVYFVPAFTGLGAPHWDADARGIITGLTRDTNAAHLVRAGLESVVYQTFDLVRALNGDGKSSLKTLRIDGGMADNAWFSQYLADICNVTVEKPVCLEATALGAGLCAGVGVGLWPDLEAATAGWQSAARYAPAMSSDDRAQRLSGWHKAVEKCRLP